MERRLTSILAADVVGYSRLVETDEAGTLAAVKALRTDVLEPLLGEHRGRIVKLLGDGIIAEFRSIVDAVGCAAALQAQVNAQREQIPANRQICLRIGVNLGDVIVEGDDLLGDGINIAARLEQLCPPGGVLISGAAHEHLAGKLDVRFDYAGEQQLKNIARPVKAYQMVGAGAPSATPTTFQNDKPAVAILPFENMSGDPEQTYFSDGITEDVITELSRFGELMVVARHSSFAFRGQSVDVRQVGRSLGAVYIVEGSVRRVGSRVRITAQLIDAGSGAHLWADRYDRGLEDVFAIQEEIAQQIVATVAQRVKEDREVVARRRRPEDIRAYDLFLQAHRVSDVFDPDAQQHAQSLFEQAIKIDPTFARSYSGLAYIYLTKATDYGIGIPHHQDENRLTALRLAEEALARDPNDPRVQSTIGFMYLTWRDFSRAERHLDLARSMNPNDPFIQADWAWMQACLGNPERALTASDIATKLNPRYPTWYNYYRARILFQLERYADAAVTFEQQTLEHPERHPRDMAWRAAAYGHLGRIEEAKACAEVFISALRRLWRGDPGAQPKQYVDWLVDVSYLRQPDDVARLRDGLRLAGLPA